MRCVRVSHFDLTRALIHNRLLILLSTSSRLWNFASFVSQSRFCKQSVAMDRIKEVCCLSPALARHLLFPRRSRYPGRHHPNKGAVTASLHSVCTYPKSEVNKDPLQTTSLHLDNTFVPPNPPTPPLLTCLNNHLSRPSWLQEPSLSSYRK